MPADDWKHFGMQHHNCKGRVGCSTVHCREHTEHVQPLTMALASRWQHRNQVPEGSATSYKIRTWGYVPLDAADHFRTLEVIPGSMTIPSGCPACPTRRGSADTRRQHSDDAGVALRMHLPRRPRSPRRMARTTRAVASGCSSRGRYRRSSCR